MMMIHELCYAGLDLLTGIISIDLYT